MDSLKVKQATIIKNPDSSDFCLYIRSSNGLIWTRTSLNLVVLKKQQLFYIPDWVLKSFEFFYYHCVCLFMISFHFILIKQICRRVSKTLTNWLFVPFFHLNTVYHYTSKQKVKYT